MAHSNADVVRDQYDATNERDWGRAMSHYADDAVLVIHGKGIRTGTFEGKEAVGGWFGDWFGTFDRDGRFDILEIAEFDDGSVAIVADYYARGRVSGVGVRGMVTWLYRFRDGKITRLEGNTNFGPMSAADAIEQLRQQAKGQ